jgi:hypothetical protein
MGMCIACIIEYIFISRGNGKEKSLNFLRKR